MAAHAAHLNARFAGLPEPARVFLGGHACLGRCPAGPSLVVRRLATDEQPDPRPGLYALSGGCHYHAVTRPLLDRVVDEHCAGRPIAGRYQAY